MKFYESASRCPHCDSSRLEQFKTEASDTTPRQEISIRECQDCGMAWQSPVARSPQESKQVFEQAYQEASCDPNSYFNQERRSATAQLQTDLLIDLLPAGSHVVDVGGGNGYFAREAASKGYRVTLVDPSLNTEDFQSDSIEALKGTLDVVAGRKFNCMTLWDVIEHVPDPEAFMHEAAKLLEAEGLLIIETGNYLSASRFCAHRNHWIFQADHRWYFSPASINSLLLKTGFRATEVVPRVLRPGWRGAPQHREPKYPQLLKAVIKQPHRASHRFAEHQRSRRAAQHPWSGIAIFTMVARRA